jgi:hypothetical protein
VSDVEPAKVSVTEARVLFGIEAVLRPHTTHVAVPVPLLQERDLLVSSGPDWKVAAVKSVVE